MSFADVVSRLGSKDGRHLKLLGTRPPRAARQTRLIPPDPVPLPCLHEGNVLERCHTCSNGAKAELRHVRECDLHGTCTRGPNNGKVASCGACGDFDALGPVGKRHLLYHLLPVIGTGVWQRGVDQLRLRWPLFTGRKIVAVMTGDVPGKTLDAPGRVLAYLPPGCEVIELPNDAGLREVVSWIPLWERLFDDADDGDAVFYAHAKGATRNVDAGNSCQWWASFLYAINLDHWPLVERLLKRHPAVGAFKKVGHGFGGSASRFHYSGAFFWQRVGEVRRRNWQGIDRQWWGSESWPGLVYHPDEAGCLFHAGVAPDLNCYAPQYWTNVVRPEYSRWLLENRPSWPWVKAQAPSAGS